MATRFKTLKEYLYPDNGKKTFIIPNYQRGYKWAVREGHDPSLVQDLMQRLIAAWRENPEQQYFLQGVTVVEDGDMIKLIDGQQRTTTLYLLLWCLDRRNISGYRDISLEYSVREKSKEFLIGLKNENFDYNAYDREDSVQDIHYFKEAIRQIREYLPEDTDDCSAFTEYLLNKISLLYIVIDAEKAVKTFTMMNGTKATMHDEELVKAQMLHLVSLPEPIDGLPQMRSIEDSYTVLREIVSTDWETNALRSKYAREWDKWLYWWNRKDVMDFFDVNKPMGLLLEYYYRIEGRLDGFSFRHFEHLLPAGNKKSAKNVFKGLRDLQKDFEDLFNSPIIFNNLKLALIGSNNTVEDKYNIIKFFFENKRKPELLERYAWWRIAGATHLETIAEPNEGKDAMTATNEGVGKIRQMITNLSEPRVYGPYSDQAFRQLLRFNVVEYNRLKAKFDFSIWENKSLEHIFPKSKFFHTEETENPDGSVSKKFVRGDGEIITEEQTSALYDSYAVFSNSSKYSEHCIGNLVLLYGKNNSEFGALPFSEKKKKFFNTERVFESRNLLHTISSFASNDWTFLNIEEYSDKLIARLKKDYEIKEEKSND